MKNKRLATILMLLIIQTLFEPSITQSYRGRGRGHHHHHHHNDDYNGGGGGLLGGLGTVLGIAGAGLIAGAVARGVTRGFGGGGYVQPYGQQFIQPLGYDGLGYADPYLPGGYGSQFVGGYASPIVGGAAYGGGYLAPVSSRVTTVSDRLYSNIY